MLGLDFIGHTAFLHGKYLITCKFIRSLYVGYQTCQCCYSQCKTSFHQVLSPCFKHIVVMVSSATIQF
ncbi:MAG: hypothetical protein XXXJIFNMEKO3_LKCDNKCA_00055 (plasmid) [Candidatus Erwinia impunctatus]